MDDTIIEGLVNMLNEFNPLAQTFWMVRDRIEASSEQQLQIRLISNRQTNDRQYNSPSTSEIATLIVGDLGDGIDGKEIIIHDKKNRLSFQYSILFPYGEDGFHDDIPYINTANF